MILYTLWISRFVKNILTCSSSTHCFSTICLMFIILASLFPLNYITSIALAFNSVTSQSSLARSTSSNGTSSISNNSTGQAHLVAKVNVSSLPKSAPYFGPHVYPIEPSPFPFSSNDTENRSLTMKRCCLILFNNVSISG
jgi:hypothetical protein